MEQKQLDELDDSFFGEEFIEDESEETFGSAAKSTKSPWSESTEELTEEPELRLKKAAKKNAAARKSSVKKSEKALKKEVPLAESKKEALKEVTIEKLETLKKAESPFSGANEKKSHLVKEKKASPEKEAKKEKETVEIKPAKEKETKTVVETSAPVNPWADEGEGSGLLKQASTWKALTGLTLVLLVLSLFTQGFNFSDKNALTGAATLSLQDAEEKALTYVNTQLLQPPFQASVQSTEELDTLYKVTLSVAGQTVDSYVTKDGKLFFPQGFDMGVGASTAPENGEEDTELSEPSAPALEVSADDDPVLGDADAPVTIVEFSDFQCPFCKKANDEALKEVKEKYVQTGKVKLVYRDFPLEFHPEAEPAALAAECADEQGKFWEYHDLLFANQASLSDANYKKWAQELGLDTEQFNGCYKGLKYLDEMRADMSDGQKYGVSGTPAFFVNGKLLTGAQPYAAFEQEIEAALAAGSVPDSPDKEPEETKLEQEPVPEVAAEEPVPGETVQVTVNAKKWLFQPSEVKVKKGSVVALTVVPDGLEFTFAVPSLGVEQQVSGATKVPEFTVAEAGKLEFTCSSCEEWRGMKGTLVVE